jgi:predicted RNA-binding Zn ribbon-like protein
MNHTIWLDLLNSDWHDHRGTGAREDRLDNPRWLEDYLSRWGLDLGGVPDEQVRAGFRGLRGALRGIVDRILAGKKVPAENLNRLNAYLARASFIRRVRIKGSEAELIEWPVGDSLDIALATVAGSFAESITQGDLSRLKVCQNKDCLWVFMDASRNRSRRWCEDVCGNLMKVRRFRGRLKEKTSQSAPTR